MYILFVSFQVVSSGISKSAYITTKAESEVPAYSKETNQAHQLTDTKFETKDNKIPNQFMYILFVSFQVLSYCKSKSTYITTKAKGEVPAYRKETEQAQDNKNTKSGYVYFVCVLLGHKFWQK